nr:6071_t:CDS:2 [Entrophospora candida]
MSNTPLPSVEEVAGPAFLELSVDELIQVGLKMGPAKTIIGLINKIKGEEQGENEENEEAPYIQKFIQFASEWVAEKVMDKLKRNYSQQLRNFVIASSSENEYSTLWGVIFEQITHRILQKGGTFNIRPLESNVTSSTIEIPEQIKLVFNDINKIEEGKYCQLIQKNFTSVDAVVAPDTLFQMTISKSILLI